jgi:hypothetical protein
MQPRRTVPPSLTNRLQIALPMPPAPPAHHNTETVFIEARTDQRPNLSAPLVPVTKMTLPVNLGVIVDAIDVTDRPEGQETDEKRVGISPATIGAQSTPLSSYGMQEALINANIISDAEFVPACVPTGSSSL